MRGVEAVTSTGFVALGGAIGAVCRYWLTILMSMMGSHFPWGTFLVNVLGSFVIGLLATFFLKLPAHLVQLNLLFITGLLGGFTTFSAFSLDSMRLFEAGNYGYAFSYIIGSVLLSLLAAALGIFIAVRV